MPNSFLNATRPAEAGRSFNYERESMAHAALLKYLANRIARVRKVIRVDDKILDSYVGTYALSGKSTITVNRNTNGLSVEYPGQSAFDVFPESEDQFFAKIADTQVAFTRNSSGIVTQLTLRQAGRERTAQKAQ